MNSRQKDEGEKIEPSDPARGLKPHLEVDRNRIGKEVGPRIHHNVVTFWTILVCLYVVSTPYRKYSSMLFGHSVSLLTTWILRSKEPRSKGKISCSVNIDV